jgi:DNA processing protein
MSDLRYWVGLSLLPEVGPVGAKKLLSVFLTPQKVFSATLDELMAVEGVGLNRAKTIKGFSSWEAAERQILELKKQGIKAVCLDDPVYPALLREIDDAPVILYMRGDILSDDKYALAIVGSRKATSYGKAVAESISEDLASMGFTIVSGMARGIDSTAHGAAIKAGGRTIAVLGTGVDTPYPSENKNLMETIVQSGYVVSEFPPGTKPERENFPRRNRLISGLSLGVIVVEAASDSGALITARYSVEQGREVFAVPGNITAPYSRGTNKLIKQGAILARNAQDIVEELAPVLKGFLKSNKKSSIKITEDEEQLCNFLSGEPKQIDIISRESGLPASRILGILLGLELKGAVKQLTGKRFYLA